MKLADLPLTDARFDPRFSGVELTGIASDSRRVRRGFLFVAVPGTKADGLAFLPQALANGAAAVITAPLAGALIRLHGVSRALLILGAGFLVGTLICFLVVRTAPSDYRPRGWTPLATAALPRRAT